MTSNTKNMTLEPCPHCGKEFNHNNAGARANHLNNCGQNPTNEKTPTPTETTSLSTTPSKGFSPENIRKFRNGFENEEEKLKFDKAADKLASAFRMAIKRNPGDSTEEIQEAIEIFNVLGVEELEYISSSYYNYFKGLENIIMADYRTAAENFMKAKTISELHFERGEFPDIFSFEFFENLSRGYKYQKRLMYEESTKYFSKSVEVANQILERLDEKVPKEFKNIWEGNRQIALSQELFVKGLEKENKFCYNDAEYYYKKTRDELREARKYFNKLDLPGLDLVRSRSLSQIDNIDARIENCKNKIELKGRRKGFRNHYSQEHLEEAIEIATKCEDPGKPKVGAALVNQDKIIKKARRNENGRGEHAEHNLFNKVLTEDDDGLLEESILVTTLEPCTVRNDTATPNCTKQILKHHYAHNMHGVVIGMIDIAPGVKGDGIKELQERGLIVDFFPPELAQEVRDINQGYLAEIS